jgi:hypothetical protein
VILGVASVHGKATGTVVDSPQELSLIHGRQLARMLKEVAGSQFAPAWGGDAKGELRGYNRKSPERGALPGFSGAMRAVPEAV